MGLILATLGAIICLAVALLVEPGGYVPRIVLFGPALVGLGASLILLPGKNITFGEVLRMPIAERRQVFETVMAEATIAHKAFWLTGIILGVLGGFIALAFL